MDITSPITLWKDYDVLALPLNATALSESTENGATVKSYYFDGYTTVDGRARTYIKIIENPEAKGVILFLHDNNENDDSEMIRYLYNCGYSVASLDYLGKSEKLHYTLYPRSLSHCNLSGVKVFNIPEGVISNWYIWTCISRRAVKLLCELYPEKKLFALGLGLGGCTVYKLATFDDGLTACATLLNIMPQIEGSGNSLINYRASLDNIAYAPFCKLPLFMAVSSNDEDGSFDDMTDLAKSTVSLKHFRIVERALSNGIKKSLSDLDFFFTAKSLSLHDLPRPSMSASNSDGNLYFNIDIGNDDLDDDSKLILYVSFCIEDPSFRNWMRLPVISLGKDKAMAHINVCNDDKPIFAFANIEDKNGIIISSELLSVIPKTLGIRHSAGIAHRKIYDGSMGKDCWTTFDDGRIVLEKGPYDIEGVSGSTFSLITFKPGDPLFKVSADTILQIMVCGKQQSLTVTVRDKTNSYSCVVDIQSESDWYKFSLSPMNFKSPSGMLLDWSQIMVLEFKSDKHFIIGSVLWV